MVEIENLTPKQAKALREIRKNIANIKQTAKYHWKRCIKATFAKNYCLFAQTQMVT